MRQLAAIIVLIGLTWEAAGDGRCRQCSRPARWDRWERGDRRQFGHADLRWRLTPGQVFYQTTNVETQQKLAILGTSILHRQTQQTVLRWEFNDWDDDGNAQFHYRIVALDWELNLGGSRITACSYNEPSKSLSALDDLAHAITRVPFEVAVKQDGTVGRFRNSDSELDNFKKKHPQLESLGTNLFRRLPEPTRHVFGSMPNRFVRADQSWRRTTTEPLDGLELSLQLRDRLTYRRSENGMCRIELDGSSHYLGTGKGLGFKLVKQPPPGKRHGTIWFDPVRHRLDSLRISATFSGVFQIEIGGQSTDVATEHEQTMHIRITDRPPPKK